MNIDDGTIVSPERYAELRQMQEALMAESRGWRAVPPELSDSAAEVLQDNPEATVSLRARKGAPGELARFATAARKSRSKARRAIEKQTRRAQREKR